MWHDHPSSQRNKTTKRAVGVEVGGKGGGGGQNLKKGGRQYRGNFTSFPTASYSEKLRQFPGKHLWSSYF